MEKAICITCSNTEYGGVSERISCLKYATSCWFDIIKTFCVEQEEHLDEIIDFCACYNEQKELGESIKYIIVSDESGYLYELISINFLNNLEEMNIYIKVI